MSKQTCGHDHGQFNFNEAKILDTTKRVMRITTGAKLTIGECSQIHLHCLANLCLEAAGGDLEQAAAIMRASMMSAAEHLEHPDLKVVLAVQNGKNVPRQ